MMLWLNGALQDSAAARLDPGERGFLLGDGLYETLAARGGKVLRLAAHAARLKRGCELLDLPFPTVDLAEIFAAVMKANQLSDAALRLTLTRGPGPRGLTPPDAPQPTLLVTAAPLPPAKAPIACIIASVTRRNEHSPLARVKSTNCLDNILAKQEAKARGADDALLLNSAGRLAESSAANLFVVKDGKIFTPPLADGCLPGVLRAELLHNLGATEQSLTPADLAGADEIFLTSSLGVQAVKTIDGKPAGKNPAEPVTQDITKKLA